MCGKSKLEGKEIIEEEHDPDHINIEIFWYSVKENEGYNKITSIKKITQKIVEQGKEATEIHNKIIVEISGKKE